MSDRPWMKFYPSDWRADPCLRMCGLSARGLWMEMLALMHEATPYGHLVVNGRQVTERQLAQLAGCTMDEVRELLMELEEAGVYSRTDDATVYSRRMLKDQEREAQAKANGSKGGNPKVKGGVNPSLNGQDKAHKPEARSQKELSDASASESAPVRTAAPVVVPKPANDPRGSRLPPGWQLPDDWREWAEQLGMPPPIVTTEADKFRDYWTGKPGANGRKSDWAGTWRNWCRRVMETMHGQRGHGQPQRGASGILAAVADLEAADRRHIDFGDG